MIGAWRSLWVVVVVLAIVPGCGVGPPAVEEPGPASLMLPDSGASGIVLETTDAAGYTYVHVDADGGTFWAAGPRFAVSVGDEVTVHNPIAMRDYYSRTLERTFDVVYFAGSITRDGGEAAASGGIPGHAADHGTPAKVDVDLSGLERPEGGKTVAEVFAESATLTGQEIAVRGRVVKFNGGILGKNWIHLRDGTGAEGSNDLVVTTAASVSVGDTVLVRGVLKTDRDLGYGYQYEVILEDASLEVE